MSTKKDKALAALLACRTTEEAAAMAGVSPKTIYNYLNTDAAFKAEYSARRKALIDGAAGELQLKMAATNRVTVELMEDGAVPPQTRLNAARTVLEYGYRAREQEGIIERLEALERVQDEQSEEEGYQ